MSCHLYDTLMSTPSSKGKPKSKYLIARLTVKGVAISHWQPNLLFVRSVVGGWLGCASTFRPYKNKEKMKLSRVSHNQLFFLTEAWQGQKAPVVAQASYDQGWNKSAVSPFLLEWLQALWWWQSASYFPVCWCGLWLWSGFSEWRREQWTVDWG